MTILQPEDKRLVCNVLRKMGIPAREHHAHMLQDFIYNQTIPYAEQRRALENYRAIARSFAK